MNHDVTNEERNKYNRWMMVDTDLTYRRMMTRLFKSIGTVPTLDWLYIRLTNNKSFIFMKVRLNHSGMSSFGRILLNSYYS